MKNFDVESKFHNSLKSEENEKSRDFMLSELTNAYGSTRKITEGPCGSIRMEPLKNESIPDRVVLEEMAKPNKFINAYSFSCVSTDASGEISKKPYFGYLRGNPQDVLNPNISHNKATGVGVVVVYTDPFGKKWVQLLEEFRPLDAWSKNNTDSRTYGIILGLVGDEKEGESMLDAARREISEEAALQIDNLEMIGRPYYLSIGAGTEKGNCYCATVSSLRPLCGEDGSPLEASTDGGTTRAWYWVPAESLEDRMDSMDAQGFTAGTGIGSLYYLFPHKESVSSGLVARVLNNADCEFLKEVVVRLQPGLLQALAFQRDIRVSDI